MGVSLLPVVFLFFFSYALVNRTLNAWFPRPLEIANEQSQILLTHFETAEFDRLNRLAARRPLRSKRRIRLSSLAITRLIFRGWPTRTAKYPRESIFTKPANGNLARGNVAPSDLAESVQTIRSGAQVWKVNGELYLAGSAL